MSIISTTVAKQWFSFISRYWNQSPTSNSNDSSQSKGNQRSITSPDRSLTTNHNLEREDRYSNSLDYRKLWLKNQQLDKFGLKRPCETKQLVATPKGSRRPQPSRLLGYSVTASTVFLVKTTNQTKRPNSKPHYLSAEPVLSPSRSGLILISTCRKPSSSSGFIKLRMCTYYYLHHHHITPCTRTIDIVVHYGFCPAATMGTAPSGDSSGPFSTASTSAAETAKETSPGAGSSVTSGFQDLRQNQVQTPCSNLYFDPSQSVDYSDPCASGGCLASPNCSSGACRLEQLNGRWTCCLCGRGGNRYRWCRHRMRRSPDTFCYHVCCGDCTADETSQGAYMPRGSATSEDGGRGAGSQ